MKYPINARPRKTLLATSSARRNHTEKIIQDQNKLFLEKDKIVNLENLYDKLSGEKLPSGFKVSTVGHHKMSLMLLNMFRTILANNDSTFGGLVKPSGHAIYSLIQPICALCKCTSSPC